MLKIGFNLYLHFNKIFNCTLSDLGQTLSSGLSVNSIFSMGILIQEQILLIQYGRTSFDL